MKLGSTLRFLCLLIPLAGCNSEAHVVALSPGALRNPLPKIELLERGKGGGPLRVTMPNGEVLMGRYAALSSDSSSSIGTAFVGRQTVVMSGFSTSMSGNFSAQAQGPRTSIVCTGNWSGSSMVATCETSSGDRYQIMV
jgi:hypothetical protein